MPSRPLPYPVIFVGSGDSAPASVRAFDAESGQLTFDRGVYEAGFTGGVNVGAADFTGGGYPDVVAAPGSGGGPRIRVLDGKSGTPLAGAVGDFLAFGGDFRGGLRVAAADVDGDGTPDIIAAAGAGGGPHVRVFSGRDASPLADYFVFDADFRGGVTLAAADFTGDGRAEVVVGAGEGGGPRVRVLDALTGTPTDAVLGDFFAFDARQRGGVNVGTDSLTGDVTGDGVADLVVGTGAGVEGRVVVYSGSTGEVVRDFVPFDTGVTGGVRVATAFVDNDAFADIVVGTGPGAASRIRVFSGLTGSILSTPIGDFNPFSTTEYGGLNLAATNDPPPGDHIITDTQTWNQIRACTVNVRVDVYGNDPAAPGVMHWVYTVENVSTHSPALIDRFTVHSPVWPHATNLASSLDWDPSTGMSSLGEGMNWIAGLGDDFLDINETATFTFDTPVVAIVAGSGAVFDLSVATPVGGPILGPGLYVVLESVTYETDHPDIVSDPDANGNSVVYSGPHYLDLNHDGDPLDAGERAYPTSFTRNDNLTVSASFYVGDVGATSSVWVRGKVDGSTILPATLATYTGNGLVTVSFVESSTAFADYVQYFEGFQIDWEASANATSSPQWVPVGSSQNELYVTLAFPQLETIYHTYIHISGTSSVGADNEQKTIDGTWTPFSGRQVKTKAGDALWYYKDWRPEATYKFGFDFGKYGVELLKHKDGSCQSWTQFFIDTLASQGVTQKKNYLEFAPKQGRTMLINNWKFTGPGSSGDPAFPYKNTLPNPSDDSSHEVQDPTTKAWSYNWGATAQVTDLPGIPGQGPNTNPISIFGGHIVATFNGVIYDTSYGVKYDTMDKWEAGAVAGYGSLKILDPDGKTTYQLFFAENTEDNTVFLRYRTTYEEGKFTGNERFKPDGTPDM